MTRLAGSYFDGKHSRRHAAVLELSNGTVRVQVDTQSLETTPLARVHISSRVGNTARFLRFPGGGHFETLDNDGLDLALARLRPRHGLAHRLESRLRYALAGLLVTVALTWGTVQWGIPALAEAAAFALPANVNRHMDARVLQALDQRLLKPSTLSAGEQTRLRTLFAPLTDELDDAYRARVLFRDAANSLGPNALALPAGTLIFTDQLVRLADDDRQLLAVLAHELAHVERRHGLRQTLQASAISLAGLVLIGDVSSVSAAVLTLPLVLTELGYSRAFEREADRHAVATLRRHDIDVAHFARILQRLERDAAPRGRKDSAPQEDTAGWDTYLSTHPATADRIRRITRTSARK